MQPAIYLAAVSRYHSYLDSAKQLLQQYHGEGPFATYAKKFFSVNKKYGSKDRKAISHLCYCYFRMGKAMINESIEEKILTAVFLCSDKPNEILAALKPKWNEKVQLPTREKLLIINHSLLIPEIFPWKNELSNNIDHEKFCESFFVQPGLFIRLRPGHQKSVTKKLDNAEIGFQPISEICLALPNASKVDSVLELDKEAVIQDYNSQRAGEFFKSAIGHLKSKINAWDCCAASGGKSIMAYDINPNIELMVSDVRESILVNLKKRFQKAGIKNYQSTLVDLTKSDFRLPTSDFNLIICDTPCTGSGTWARTPEQLHFFDVNEIERYSSLQRKIVSNVIPHLQKGGAFIYITC